MEAAVFASNAHFGRREQQIERRIIALTEITEREPPVSRRAALEAAYREYAPGLAVSLTVAVAATFLSEHYGGPVMLFALLLGMAFHFLSQEGRTVAGIELASKGVLRIAVGLLGAQITIAQIMNLGLTPVLTMVAAVVLTIFFGIGAAWALGLSRRFGMLTGGAVAICGASAALAISSVLPKNENHERDTVFTVIAVTTLSTIAMVVYPIIVARMHLSHEAAGIFLGGTIHDVAQVVGAGYSVSDETGNVATFIKLLRVTMLLPVVFGMAFIMHAHYGSSGGPKKLLPGFLLLFAALVLLNSAQLIPQDVLTVLKNVSRWCLVTAIAALGMKTSLKAMAAVGARPIALMVAETVFLALLVLAVVIFERA
jgi:uncharacterized integral membrane protein (TIGR00698 family)